MQRCLSAFLSSLADLSMTSSSPDSRLLLSRLMLPLIGDTAVAAAAASTWMVQLPPLHAPAPSKPAAPAAISAAAAAALAAPPTAPAAVPSNAAVPAGSSREPGAAAAVAASGAAGGAASAAGGAGGAAAATGSGTAAAAAVKVGAAVTVPCSDCRAAHLCIDDVGLKMCQQIGGCPGCAHC